MSIIPFKKEAPVRLLSEEDVRMKLGIEDFRHVTKSQVVELVSSLSQMDPEVAKKVIEQVPEFMNTALGMAREMKEGYVAGLKANDESSKKTVEILDSIIGILEEDLKNDGLTPEERIQTVKSLERLGEKAIEVHRLNQQFILDSLAMVAKFAGATLLGAVVILGANGKFELPDLRK